MMEKACKGCGELKPLDAYHKHKSLVSGRVARCKACVKAAYYVPVSGPRKKRKYEPKNPMLPFGDSNKWLGKSL